MVAGGVVGSGGGRWVLLKKGTASGSGSGAHNNSDGGGENRSAEGNKVLKYVLVHGRQWVWAMVGSGSGCVGVGSGCRKHGL